jgi:hypothetical protein
VYLDFFQHFEPFVKENFLKNYDKLFAFAENKSNLFCNPTILSTSFYTMNAKIDYKRVLEKLASTKELVLLG